MNKTPEFRTRYTPSDDPGISFKGEKSLTKEQFADDADINKIMKRFEQTGVLPDMAVTAPPLYLDLSDVGTFQDAQNLVADANSLFMSLPARARDRFENDPSKFLAYMNSDKANDEELINLGLSKKRAEELMPEPKKEEQPKEAPKKDPPKQ